MGRAFVHPELRSKNSGKMSAFWKLSYMDATAVQEADTFMAQSNRSAPIAKKQLWAGRIMSALPALFLLVDGGMRLVKPAPVVEATVQLGYAENVILWLGIVLLTCTVIYLIPQTSVLGALLLTGYLGGAVATHVRVGTGWFSILFPVILGVMLWGGLYLRDDRLRALLAWQKNK